MLTYLFWACLMIDSSIFPLDEQNQQEPQAEQPLTLLPSSPVRFKGSPYVFKRRTQQQQPILDPPLAPVPSPNPGTRVTCSLSVSLPNSIASYLDLPIDL